METTEWGELLISHHYTFPDDPEDLFRKGSFATQLMYRYFFSELGKKYLRATVLPLINSIIEADPTSLEVSHSISFSHSFPLIPSPFLSFSLVLILTSSLV
jgi:hypothetical protein